MTLDTQNEDLMEVENTEFLDNLDEELKSMVDNAVEEMVEKAKAEKEKEDYQIIDKDAEITIGDDIPRLTVASKDLKALTDIISQQNGTENMANTILMYADGNELVCKNTDYKHYLSVRLPIVNKENILTDVLQLDNKSLIAVLKAAGRNVTIYKDSEATCKAFILGGEVSLDLAMYKPDKYEDVMEFEPYTTIKNSVFSKTLKDFIKIMNSAQTTNEKSIRFLNDYAYCINSRAYTISNDTYGEFSISNVEVKQLREILNFFPDDDLQVEKSGNSYLRIKGDNFSFSFTTMRVSPIDDSDLEKINALKSKKGYIVDRERLEIILDLIYTLYTGSGVIKVKPNFNANADEIFSINFMNNGEEQTFNIVTSRYELDEKPEDVSIEVPTTLLKNILQVYDKSVYKEIKITLSEDGLCIVADNYVSVILMR